MIAMCTRIRLCGRAPAPFRGGGDVPLLAQVDEGKESVQGYSPTVRLRQQSNRLPSSHLKAPRYFPQMQNLDLTDIDNMMDGFKG